MSELANYSIETDHIVLLAFRDGRRLRVPVGQLAHHLTPPDLDKVRAALKLRRDFIRRHMPKVVLAIAAAGGLIAALTLGGHAVASLWQKSHPPVPAPNSTGLVRSETLPHTAPTPSNQAATATASSVSPTPPATTNTIAATTTTHRAVTHASAPGLIQTVSKTVKTVLPVVLPTGSPTPSPTPQVAGNQPGGSPAPLVSPTPTPAPNSGQVLGCSTTTDPNCGADSGSVAPTIP